MAGIQKEIELAGSKGKERVIALFDSGSTYSCIRLDIAEKLGIVEHLPEPLTLATAKNGESLEVEERITLDFRINGYRFDDLFMVIPELSEKVIIGAKTLQAWRLKLDFENDEVIIDPRVTKLRLL
ncbi:MAG: retropepsin-like aspartic protease [Candidatus Edwardsbacteria bacterium]